MPNMRVDNPMGEALIGVGGAISNAADVAGQIAERQQQQQQKKEDFKADNDYRRLQLSLGESLQTNAENMAEDGTGFHKSFMTDVYAPARNQFMAGLPDRLKQKYGVILGDETPDGGGADTTAWSIKAATTERDKLYSWYDNQLKIGQDELQTAISLDPDGYDKILQQGLDQIEASGLPSAKKEEQRQSWTKLAQVAHLNKMLETRPEQVLKDLGADPRMLTPTTQYSLLKQALTHQESGGKDDAISPKGAIGRMQIMPNTARDISKWRGDGLIDKNMSNERITEILSNPTLNEAYGDFYLKKQIKDFSAKGGVEAALVAYNAGPGVAQAWIDSGFDNSKLPAETRNYVRSIMGNLPSMTGQDRFPGSAPKGDPAQVQFVWNGRTDLKAQGNDSALNQDMVGRVKSAFAGLGINKVRINSGFRDEAENAAVGGAKRSQHTHGNAIDIDVSGYSVAERVNIIKALSAAGITGLGIGSNMIHADTGGRRAWGYASSAGGGAIPKWAQGAITEHLEGRAQAPSRTSMGGRYAGLPYDMRQKFVAAADQQVAQMQTQANKATALQKVETQTAMRNELAALQTTGKSPGLVDDTAVSTVLGEDDYFKWVQDKDRALRTYSARDGIAEMSLQEMDDRLKEYTPDEGSATFADDQKVQAAVQKEIDRVQKLRASDPTEGAMLYKDVKAKFEAIDTEDPQPEAVQEFVRANLERQKEFGIKPGSEQPIPKPWAVSIGQTLSKIPELQGKNKDDVNAAIIVLYDSLKKTFGDYTDEVIISALKEYKGTGPNTAELINGYMQAIQGGGDPLGRVRAKADRALDADQVEGATQGGFWQSMGDFFRGSKSDPTKVPAASELSDPNFDAQSEVFGRKGKPGVQGDVVKDLYNSQSGGSGVNEEQLLRARTAIENLGDEMTPEQEQSLVRRFGQKVIDAAKAGSQP